MQPDSANSANYPGPRHLPGRRVILLGASNLTRAISTVIETAGRLWGRPLDVMAAYGHGRSYGWRMAMLGRELPGIAECGLWTALRRRPLAPTAALITDVGNDLLYDAPPTQIADWVAACLDQLQEAGARVVMTRLPLARLESISQVKYLLLRTLFFPGCRLALDTVRERAQDLDRRLMELADRPGVSLVAHDITWYGFDPIHIKMRHWPRAWRDILSRWCNDKPVPEPAPPSFGRWLYLRLLPPEVRWFFGHEFRRTQPTGRLPDGTIVSLY